MKKIYVLLCVVFIFTSCLTVEKKTHRPGDSEVAKIESTKNDLTNKYWEMIGLQTDTVFLDIMPGHGGGGILRFFNNGNFECTSGLNTGSGTWKAGKEVDEFTQKFSFALTEKTSLSGENEQANASDRLFYEALKNTAYIHYEDHIIVFLDKNKKPVFKFFYN